MQAWLLPSPSSWQEVGRRLAFLQTMRWRRGWKGNFGRAIFWKINFGRAFCDQSITLCAGHRRPSSETKVTSCNSLSFRDFTAILFHVLHLNKQCIHSPCVSSCPLSLPRIYCSTNDIFSVPKWNFNILDKRPHFFRFFSEVFFRTPSLINIIICNVIFFFYSLL